MVWMAEILIEARKRRMERDVWRAGTDAVEGFYRDEENDE
jgi:hypothetical protein